MNTIRLNVLGEAKAASPGVSIKNQDKSVDIVENGVTEVTADSGYTGLGKVTINANVQGGGSSSGGNIEYYRIDWDRARELGYKPLSDYDQTFDALTDIYGLVHSFVSYSDYLNYAEVSYGGSKTYIISKSGYFFLMNKFMSGMMPEEEIKSIKVNFPIVNIMPDYEQKIQTFTEMAEAASSSGKLSAEEFTSIFIPITESEFFNLEA